MSLEVKIFEDGPKKKERLEPGDIIQAVPGSYATKLGYTEAPGTEDPSGVFGYVVGYTVDQIPRRMDQRLMQSAFNYGETLIYKVIPKIDPRDHSWSPLDSLSRWANTKESQPPRESSFDGPFLVYGKVTYDQDDLIDHSILDKMNEGAILFNDKALHEFRKQMETYMRNQPQTRFGYQIPGGQRFTAGEMKIVKLSE